MDPTKVFEWIPFARELGIELTEASDGHAVGHLELADWHSSNPQGMVAHGGVAYSLADTVGGAAAVSANDSITPTIDMRIDYLDPATGEELNAEARGVYKTGGGDDETPWTADADRSGRGSSAGQRE